MKSFRAVTVFKMIFEVQVLSLRSGSKTLNLLTPSLPDCLGIFPGSSTVWGRGGGGGGGKLIKAGPTLP